MKRVALALAGLALLPSAARAQAPARQVAAHRSRLSPAGVENDLAEMKHTAAAGPYWLEMDLRTTRDGVVFMLHDETLERTTDGAGPIRAKDARAVAALHVRDGAGRLTAAAPTRLDAVLDWAAATPGVRLVLDAKAVDPAQVAAGLRRRGLLARSVYLTFDAAAARAALAADPDLFVSVLAVDAGAVQAVRALAPGRRLAVYLPQDADARLARSAHALGLQLVTDAIPGFTRGQPLDVRAEAQGPSAYRAYLADRPVDLLVTNHPEQVEAAVGRPEA